MPPSFTSHFSPPPIRPATTLLLLNLNLAPTLTPLPTRNLHPTPTPLPTRPPAARRNPDESNMKITKTSPPLPVPTSLPLLRRFAEVPPVPILSGIHRDPPFPVPLSSSPSLHVRVMSEYSYMPNATNLDFSEQNKRFANVECKSTLTSNFNSCGLQPITPTNSIAQKRKPRITTLLPNRVGVMSKYSDTPSRTNHDFPEQNTTFTTHERRSTPTQDFNLRSAPQTSNLTPVASQRWVRVGVPQQRRSKKSQIPSRKPHPYTPTCWFTPTRNFDFCAPLRFNSVPFAPLFTPCLVCTFAVQPESASYSRSPHDQINTSNAHSRNSPSPLGVLCELLFEKETTCNAESATASRPQSVSTTYGYFCPKKVRATCEIVSQVAHKYL
jgi:hypothetical protein